MFWFKCKLVERGKTKNITKSWLFHQRFQQYFFQAVIISKYQINDFMIMCLNFISVLVADLITP